MKNQLNIAALLLMLVFVLSCSPTLNYLGESYAPTEKVDIFFDAADVEKEYKVMGVVKNEGFEIDLNDPESMKEAMVKKAKEVGADAVLFVGFYEEKEVSRTTTTTFEKNNAESVSTSDTEKIYEAKFLKYKN